MNIFLSVKIIQNQILKKKVTLRFFAQISFNTYKRSLLLSKALFSVISLF